MRLTMLSGGVGGARMARGFAALPEVDLSVIVNVGDDDVVHGLHVSPDLDTVVYTLAGMDGEQGWGRAKETWRVMTEMERFPIDTSFRLGDLDLATNLFRTDRLAAGRPLSEITATIADAFEVPARILPATDDRVRTMLRRSDTGSWLDFQTYFVRRQHRDPIDDVRFEGIETARPAPGVIDAINGANLVVIGPSNPIVSIRPILEVPGVADAMAGAGRVVAVSPLVGGRALKGPAAELLASFGHSPGTAGVLEAYGGLVTHVVVDTADEAEVPEGVATLATDTRISQPEAGARLARELCAWMG